MNTMQASALFSFILFPAILFATPTAKDHHLCKDQENTIFSFTITKNNKIASLCEGEDGAYLAYRYGVSEKVELQYPEKLDKSSWEKFKLTAYSRGGGVENDAMGDYSLSFKNHDAQYVISQNWRLAENEYFIGVLVEADGKRYVLQGDKDSQIGSLTRLEENSNF